MLNKQEHIVYDAGDHAKIFRVLAEDEISDFKGQIDNVEGKLCVCKCRAESVEEAQMMISKGDAHEG